MMLLQSKLLPNLAAYYEVRCTGAFVGAPEKPLGVKARLPRSSRRHATQRLLSTNSGTPIIGAIDIGYVKTARASGELVNSWTGPGKPSWSKIGAGGTMINAPIRF